MFKRAIHLPSLTLLLVVAYSPVQAATVTQTVNLGYIATVASSAFTFNQFDPTLGLLNSVTASFNGDFHNSLGFINLGSAANFAIDFTEQATIKGPDNAVIFQSGTLTNSFSRMMGANESFSANLNLSNGFNNLYSLPLRSYHGAKTWSHASELALFSGLNTVSLPFFASASYVSQIDNGFGLALGQTSTRATMALTYDYAAAVPEAETYLLLLVGLGLVWLRYQRTRANG